MQQEFCADLELENEKILVVETDDLSKTAPT